MERRRSLRVTLAWMAVIGLSFVGKATAGHAKTHEAALGRLPTLWEWWRARRCWCDNDYQSKPCPSVPMAPTGCCDDYAKKVRPDCPPRPPRGGDECFDEKPAVMLRWGFPHWYQCGPSATGQGPPRGERAH